MSQEIFKGKHYRLMVHCRPLKSIFSKIDTLLQKMCMRVTTMAPTKTQAIRAECPKFGNNYP